MKKMCNENGILKYRMVRPASDEPSGSDEMSVWRMPRGCISPLEHFKSHAPFVVGLLTCMVTTGWLLLVPVGVPTTVFLFCQMLQHWSNSAQSDFEEIVTSTQYRYDKKFQDTLDHYRRFSSLYCPEASPAVPGLEHTEVLGEGCEQMVPQGICIAGDYMLVTAYDNVRYYAQKTGREYKKVNNSVLYVLSNQESTKYQLLTTIVLPDINHVGGVTFDGENVWIAKSSTKMCSRISYDKIRQAVRSGETSYALLEYDQNVPCGAVASFVTYYDGKLWVGTYSNRISKKGTLRSFDIKQKSTSEGIKYELQKEEEILIPGYANGVEFVESGGKTFMALVSSKGRYFDSNIYFYQVVRDPYTGKNLYDLYGSCKFPPMAEELVCDGENTYFLFESSATCYSALAYAKCKYPVDRICALSTQELFLQNGMAGYQKTTPQVQRNYLMCTYDQIYQERRYWQQYL